jgi:16S rRNA (cytosine967-C5)-methyltransferase
VRENSTRVGTTNVGFAAADARYPPIRSVPQILIDAPCTGTGTLRRHPDGKWRLTPADLAALVALQREILTAVAPCLPPGGLLVYATCALEPEENEQQVADFLSEHDDFRLEPPARFDPAFLSDGQLRVLPQEHGFDGAYAARLRRVA